MSNPASSASQDRSRRVPYGPLTSPHQRDHSPNPSNDCSGSDTRTHGYASCGSPPLDHGPGLELSSLPSPRLVRPSANRPLDSRSFPHSSADHNDDGVPYPSGSAAAASCLLDRDRPVASSAVAAASCLSYDSDHELDQRHHHRPSCLPSPRSSSNPSRRTANTDPNGGFGFGARLYDYMKATATHFPLLRSSPAVGTGSYGALPASYQGSGTSSEIPSDEDHGASSEEDEGPLLSSAIDEPVDGKPRNRKWKGVRAGAKARNGQVDHQSVSDDAGSESDAVVNIDDEEDEDENDPADNSPYAEVRASVLATDDESLSINTPRMWTLSLLFALVGSSTNLFFSLRYPSISITPVIALLLAHPLGKLWDQAFSDDLEDNEAKPSGMLGRLRRWLGQGRWNRKEHACVYISSNVSFGFAFATDVRLSWLGLSAESDSVPKKGGEFFLLMILLLGDR